MRVPDIVKRCVVFLGRLTPIRGNYASLYQRHFKQFLFVGGRAGSLLIDPPTYLLTFFACLHTSVL